MLPYITMDLPIIGGIYEDVNTFKIKHPQVHKIFENAIEQLI